MAVPQYKFVNAELAAAFAVQFLTKTNVRIGQHIVQPVNDTSKTTQMASAKATYDLVTALTESIRLNLTQPIDQSAARINTNANDIQAIQVERATRDTRLVAVTDKINVTIPALIASFQHLTIETVTGNIATTVTTPSNTVLYFQRDNDADTSWELYIYKEAADGNPAEWRNVGSTEVDLTNYWQKTSITELREALGMHDATPIELTSLETAITTGFDATAVTF